jgi:hypothetical protein
MKRHWGISWEGERRAGGRQDGKAACTCSTGGANGRVAGGWSGGAGTGCRHRRTVLCACPGSPLACLERVKGRVFFFFVFHFILPQFLRCLQRLPLQQRMGPTHGIRAVRKFVKKMRSCRAQVNKFDAFC